jgi:hypothetical protein
MQNPLNLRRGAQYTGIANGVPTPSIESDECDPVESEVNQQEPRNIVSPSSVNGPHVQPTAVVSEIPLSETERALEGAICATMTPSKPLNVRQGAHYVGLQVPDPRVASDGDEHDQSQQDERVDSATSGIAPTPTPFLESGLSRHINHVKEWYHDSHIAEFIRYTEYCLTAKPPRPVTTFYNVTTIAHPYPSMACLMLQEAHREGLAELSRSTDTTEVYTVGAADPATQFRGGFGPHWWVGKTPAHVLVGPMAEKNDIRNAQKRPDRETNEKQYRNRRLDDQRRKTVEGVRRQRRGLPMCDDEDGDVEMPDA